MHTHLENQQYNEFQMFQNVVQIAEGEDLLPLIVLDDGFVEGFGKWELEGLLWGEVSEGLGC